MCECVLNDGIYNRRIKVTEYFTSNTLDTFLVSLREFAFCDFYEKTTRYLI